MLRVDVALCLWFRPNDLNNQEHPGLAEDTDGAIDPAPRRWRWRPTWWWSTSSGPSPAWRWRASSSWTGRGTPRAGSCRPRTAVAWHTLSLSTARRSSGWSRTWTSLWRGRDRRDSVITHPCPGCHSGCEQPKLENICRQISAQVKGYHRWKPDYPRPRQEDPSSPCLAWLQTRFSSKLRETKIKTLYICRLYKYLDLILWYWI